MRALLVVSLLAAVGLAGCTGPDIPDDAFVATHPDLEGATLWAWLDTSSPNYTFVKGHFEYAGKELLHSDWSDPRGQWNLTIHDEAGRAIIFDERPSRKGYHQPEGYQVEESFSQLWQHREYERYSQAGVHEAVAWQPVPPGNYTVTLQYAIAVPIVAPDAFQIAMPLQIQ